MKEYIEFQDLHELLKELAQKEYGEKYGEQVFWYFEDVIENNCKIEKLEEEIERLNNKIDKAIEFINDNSHSNIKMNFMNKSGKIECKFNNNTDPRDLLDILQGSDKE